MSFCHIGACESALERFWALLFGKKILSFLQSFFRCIFPLVFGTDYGTEMDLGFLGLIGLFSLFFEKLVIFKKA